MLPTLCLFLVLSYMVLIACVSTSCFHLRHANKINLEPRVNVPAHFALFQLSVNFRVADTSKITVKASQADLNVLFFSSIVSGRCLTRQ